MQAQSQVGTANKPGAAATITTPVQPAAVSTAGAATVSTIIKPSVTQTVVVKAGTALSPPGMAPQVRMHTPGGRRGFVQVTKPSPDPNVSWVVSSFSLCEQAYGSTTPLNKT